MYHATMRVDDNDDEKDGNDVDDDSANDDTDSKLDVK